MSFILGTGGGAGELTLEGEISQFVAGAKKGDWGVRTSNSLSISSSTASTQNAIATSPTYRGSWNHKSSTVSGAGSSVGYFSTVRQTRIEDQFYFVSESSWYNPNNIAVFMGLDTTTQQMPDTDPSSSLNLIGVGKDAADTNLQVIHNDGTGVATKIDLGADFSMIANTYTTWRVELYSRDGTQNFFYRVKLFAEGGYTAADTGYVEVTTDLPVNNTVIAPKCYGNRRADSSSTVVSKLNFIEIYV